LDHLLRTVISEGWCANLYYSHPGGRYVVRFVDRRPPEVRGTGRTCEGLSYCDLFEAAAIAWAQREALISG
jgi:hypothetical protein